MTKRTEIHISRHFPLLHIEGNIALTRNGNLVMGYSIQYPETYSLSESGYDALFDSWQKAFHHLPDGTILHKQDVYVQSPFSTKTLKGSNYFQKATSCYFDGKPYLKHEAYLYFTFAGDSFLKSTGIRNPFKKIAPVNSIIEELQHKQGFISEVQQAVAFLNSGILSVSPLSSDSLLKNTKAYFNGLYTDRLTNSFTDGDRFISVRSK